MSLMEENWSEQTVKNALRANASKSGHCIVQDGVKCLIDRSDTAGCNGSGWRTDQMYTLNTVDRPAVCYDARGNGDGETAPTMTGDHENRITDYTTVLVEKHE